MGVPNLLLYSPGLGYINRGLETFTRELHQTIHEDSRLAVTLFQGRGEDTVDKGRVVWAPRRTSWLYDILPFNVPRGRRYFVESLFFSLPIVKAAYQQKHPIIHFSESVPARVLYHLRERFGGEFTLLFSNGGPIAPQHYMRFDYIQVLNPAQKEEALDAGYPEDRLFLVPYGLNCGTFDLNDEQVKDRESWGLPEDRTIVLSVGAINTHHKRMHWLVEEFAELDSSAFFLWMVGQEEGKETDTVKRKAESLLEPYAYRYDTVPYRQMPQVYAAADQFALCSVKEGFGRVYIEAMASRLPVIAHRTANTEWILGADNPGLIDMTERGALAQTIQQLAQNTVDSNQLATENKERTWAKFDWEALRSRYVSMYETISENE